MQASSTLPISSSLSTVPAASSSSSSLATPVKDTSPAPTFCFPPSSYNAELHHPAICSYRLPPAPPAASAPLRSANTNPHPAIAGLSLSTAGSVSAAACSASAAQLTATRAAAAAAASSSSSSKPPPHTATPKKEALLGSVEPEGSEDRPRLSPREFVSKYFELFRNCGFKIETPNDLAKKVVCFSLALSSGASSHKPLPCR